MLRLFQENKSYGPFALILCLHGAAHHDITSHTVGISRVFHLFIEYGI
jgi:hypothetical protein